ncbi:MAG: hypothetical protein PHT15_09585, partial [Gallionellaceae bacterium]|nr:hypothetical protein [Gallionellaceae bacterium]
EQLHNLLMTLSQPQQAAINMIRLSLDCFNSADGTGMFTGVERYNVLAGRVEISAVQADSLPRFWALLLRRMQWPVPPKYADDRILAAISAPDARDVLRALATETASIITLARMWHDQDKAARKALRAYNISPETGEIAEPFGPEAGDIGDLLK